MHRFFLETWKRTSHFQTENMEREKNKTNKTQKKKRKKKENKKNTHTSCLLSLPYLKNKERLVSLRRHIQSGQIDSCYVSNQLFFPLKQPLAHSCIFSEVSSIPHSQLTRPFFSPLFYRKAQVGDKVKLRTTIMPRTNHKAIDNKKSRKANRRWKKNYARWWLCWDRTNKSSCRPVSRFAYCI